MRKKFVSIILGVACMASLLTGCQMKDSSQPGQEVSGTQKQETAGQESSACLLYTSPGLGTARPKSCSPRSAGRGYAEALDPERGFL